MWVKTRCPRVSGEKTLEIEVGILKKKRNAHKSGYYIFLNAQTSHMQNYAWQLCMITGLLPHTLEKSNKLFMPSHLPPYKLNNNVPRVYIITPLLLTHLGTLKKNL
jgi:hypothetical protein